MPTVDLPRLYAIVNNKLKTRVARGEDVQLSGELVVVLNASDFLYDAQGRASAADLSGGAGTFVTYYTVPVRKRWHITRYWRGLTLATTRVSAQMREQGTDPPVKAEIQITTNGTAQESGEMDLVLDPGDSIGMRATGNVGDTGVQLCIAIREEDV